MKRHGIKDVNILLGDSLIKGNITFNDKIISIGNNITEDMISFDEKVYVLPGFIDQHIHGVNGSDTMDSSIDALKNMSLSLAKEGTTSYLATTITQSEDNLINALKNVNNYYINYNNHGAKLLGVNLEGPFISKKHIGAQPEKYIVKPDVSTFKKYQDASGNLIKLVTFAPEEDNDYELTNYLYNNKIVPSIGHSNATFDIVEKAIGKGLKCVTHTFNAMLGLHHRDIGVVGAALLKDELKTELICDGIHVSQPAIKLLKSNKKVNDLILVTDSMRAKGLKDGDYELGGQKIIVKNGAARLENGALAGSVLTKIDAFKNMIKFSDSTIEEVSKMSSENSAKLLGIFDKKGSIEVGKDADLIILNENLDLLMTICNGKITYDASLK